MLAISETKTSNQIFNNLAFKEFSLAELEKALAGQ
jgi:hypothetical protein